MYEEIKKTWQDMEDRVSSQEGLITRDFGFETPLDILACIETQTKKKSIVIECDKTIVPDRKFLETKGFEVKVDPNPKKNNFVSIFITLTEDKFFEEFKSISYEIISLLMKCKNEKDAIKKLYWKIDRLREFFQNRYTGLNTNKQIGLFGELHFLLNFLIPNLSLKAALKSWQSPDSGLHDFIFNKNLIEIKTTTDYPAHYVTVANENQLDSNRVDGSLYMCLIEISNGDDNDNNAKSLVQIIKKIKFLCEESKEDLLEFFSTSLIRSGYFEEHEKKYNQKYIVNNMQFFFIDEKFPIIKRTNIPSEIHEIKYSIDVGKCQKWLKNPDQIKEIIKKI